jgi:hypothetical protein
MECSGFSEHDTGGKVHDTTTWLVTTGRNGKQIEGGKRTGRTRSDSAEGYQGNAKMSRGSPMDLPLAAGMINELAHRRV